MLLVKSPQKSSAGLNLLKMCCIRPPLKLTLAIITTVFIFYLMRDQSNPSSLHASIIEMNDEVLTQKSCEPRSHIYFLKMHKCGSTAIQNILMRWGFQHQLKFVLPKSTHITPEHPSPHKRGLIEPSFFNGRKKFDILAHHFRFDEAAITELMEKDLFRFTVLREPSALFESLYAYYRLGKSPMKEYKRYLRAFVDSLSISELEKNPPMLGRKAKLRANNQMAFDYGMFPEDFGNDTKVQELIARMDAEFDLVLIADRMEESLVLLAEALCWPLETMATFRMNGRPPASRVNLTDEDRQKLRVLNSVDVKIYKHFEKKFEQRVLQYGQNQMDEQVMKLWNLNERMYDQCVQEETVEKLLGKFEVVRYKAKTGASEVCRLMTMTEPEFNDHYTKAQLQFLNFGGSKK